MRGNTKHDVWGPTISVGAAVAVVVALLVVPAMGVEPPPPDYIDLVLTDEASQFETGLSGTATTTQGVTTSKGCVIDQSSEPLIDLKPDGSKTPVPGIKDLGIGIKSPGSNSNGTPCSQVDGPEVPLVMELGDDPALASHEFERLRLDLEMTGDAVVQLTLVGSAADQVFFLETGTSITVCDPDGSDPSLVDCEDEAPAEDYYAVTTEAPDTTSACAAPNSSGPNAGGNDNCIWTVVPANPFSRVEIDVVDIGTVSLEGGSDTSPFMVGDDEQNTTRLWIQEKLGSISGQKWRDHDNDGMRDDFEAGINGWEIKVLDSEGTIVDTATTATVDGEDGHFTVGDLPYGMYTVCEVPPAPPSDVPVTWHQSNLGPDDGDCSGVMNAEPHGHVVTVDGDEVGADFLNVRTLTLTDDPTTELDCDNLPEDGVISTGGNGEPLGTITIDPNNCKAGEFVFETYLLTVDGQVQQVADFYPLTLDGYPDYPDGPDGDPATNDGTWPQIPLVEDYEWVVTDSLDQQTLEYDDIAPYDDALGPMQFCQKPWEMGDSTDGVLPDGETSCLLETTEVLTADGVQRTDRIFTLVDGRRALR